ncbi:MAG: tyrosine-type recombinase/integrase [Acetobacteraceae bacterium]|nr:tyrosine-type recombinase/integrase [Acetobacteraceae bacterium]
MAGGARPVTATEVKAVFARGAACRLTVGNGLHLWVKGPGKAQWVLRYRAPGGKRRDMGLGAYPKVSLADARAAAAAARSGTKDPLAVREKARREEAARAERAAEARTFKAAALALVEAKRPGWRNAKHGDQWLATLEAYAFPAIGDTPVAEVDTAAVRRVLDPIWQRIPETASRVRQRVEAVLDAARVEGWRGGENPARWKGHLAARMPAPRKVKPVRSRPALPWPRMGAFMAALRGRSGRAPLALRFIVLTAARTGEVRGMRWQEVDLDAAVWTVPGQRMKGGKVHRVPLSPAALDVLRELLPLRRTGTDLVFPGGREGQALSDMAISEVVRRMNEGGAEGEPPRWRDHEGRAVVPHGFRATFKVWSLAQGFPDTLSEMALAHADRDKVRGAYLRADMLEPEARRPMMEAWAAECATVREDGRDVPDVDAA